MPDQDLWQSGNEEYLAAALAWLRLLLEQRSSQQLGPLIETAAPVRTVNRWRILRWWAIEEEVEHPLTARSTVPLLPPANITDEQIKEAAAAVEAAAARMETPPALVGLGQYLRLSKFERDVLLLCAAIELDTRIALLCALAHGDAARPYPTFALAMSLFQNPAWDVVSPERPLRYWRLVDINQPGAQPLTTSPLRADERVVNCIKGLDYLDDRLAPLVMPLDAGEGEIKLPPSQQAVVDMIVKYLKESVENKQIPVVQLLGPDLPSKRLVGLYAAMALGLHPYRLPVELLPARAEELETLSRLWQRESLLLPVILYLDAHEFEGGPRSEGQTPSLHRFLARANVALFLDSQDRWPGVGDSAASFDISKPTKAEQQAAWVQVLGDTAPQSPSRLAAQFNLSIAAINQLAHSAITEQTKQEKSLDEKVWDACLESTRPQLNALAQRIEPIAGWNDIVLPQAETDLLRQIANQVGQRSKVYEEWGFARKTNRGLSVNALFAGESGTGKTMAAEVIANELRLSLYRIDLSAVVSKYIGETEKNLRRLFNAAEDGGAILFFDEADALFGKRSEVKDSHDRYANIEINYLLQRIETYSGLAILATNMKSALDSAFLRRLRFIVNFPFPGTEQRREIWLKAFPTETEIADLDYDQLASLNLTGGSIHNIAINAAFLAAQQDSIVTMPLILDAARTEFRKLERPINEADFRWIATA